MDWIVESNSAIIVIRWLDNGIVQLASNYIGKTLGPPPKRLSKKERRKVSLTRFLLFMTIINMGGADVCDMILALCCMYHRSIKYVVGFFTSNI